MPVMHTDRKHTMRTAVAAILLGTTLAATPLLAGCQAPEDQPEQGQEQGDAQNTKSQAAGGGESSTATGGSEEGGSSTTSDDGSEATGSDDGEHVAKPSTKTSFDDTWMVDSAALDDTAFDAQDILSYELNYETVCFFELYDDDGDRTFQANMPGLEVVGDWEESGENEVTLHIMGSDGKAVDLVGTMTDGYQKLTVEGSINGVALRAVTHRDDDTSITTGDIISTAIDANRLLYEELPVDSPLDIPFADDPSVRLRVIGTTHVDELSTMGYLIEATNKTDALIIANDLVANPFVVHGIRVYPSYARVLPFKSDDGDTTPVRIYLAFDRDAIGGDMSDMHGEIVLTNYDWDEIGRYAFNL